MKHLGIDFHFVYERIENNKLKVSHISNKFNEAYIMTKALQPKVFQDIQVKIVGEAPIILKGSIKD